MKLSGWARLWIVVAAMASGCGESEPKHYFALCEEKDGRGWTPIDAEKDKRGYLMACTYQSPDKQQVETLRCRKDGCD
jgi:hypothetical protein